MTRLTRKKAIEMVFNSSEPKCGGCHHYRPYEEEGVGSCRFNPPTWVLDEDGDEITGWPTITADEFGCGQFKAAQ